jgi:hypothetical protein
MVFCAENYCEGKSAFWIGSHFTEYAENGLLKSYFRYFGTQVGTQHFRRICCLSLFRAASRKQETLFSEMLVTTIQEVASSGC